MVQLKQSRYPPVLSLITAHMTSIPVPSGECKWGKERDLWQEWQNEKSRFMSIDKLLVSLPLVYGWKVQYISLHKDESMSSDSTVKYATLEASAWKNTLQRVSLEHHQPSAPGWSEWNVSLPCFPFTSWHAENKIWLLLWLSHLANNSKAKAKQLWF